MFLKARKTHTEAALKGQPRPSLAARDVAPLLPPGLFVSRVPAALPDFFHTGRGGDAPVLHNWSAKPNPNSSNVSGVGLPVSGSQPYSA